jgi:leader peptidase (prepilin peptidase) / N-methyltransferase
LNNEFDGVRSSGDGDGTQESGTAGAGGRAMIYPDPPSWVIYLTLLVLGSIIGSFLNVCIDRIPQKDGFWDSLRELSNRPSQCRRCRSHIRWQQNIPIFGWLFLRGRCADCRAWNSPRYPLIELLNALLFVVVYGFEIGADHSNALRDSCLWTNVGPDIISGLGLPPKVSSGRRSCRWML